MAGLGGVMHCYASCAFGIEGVLADEMRALGFADVSARDARVYFSADEAGVARANMFLRTADRVYIVLGEFEARTFEALFDSVAAIPFADMLPKNAKFPVNANAVSSTLMSVSDVQSISKKAIVRAMQKKHKVERFAEDGAQRSVYVNIYKDMATVALNTSGTGLNRRGYRKKNVQAPMRETLAAAMILISRWRTRDFFDPMCGSGTIAIEAAMLACDMAPGIKRGFEAQDYGGGFAQAFKDAREQARERVKKPAMAIYARDIDMAALGLAKEHAQNMDVKEYIQFEKADVRKFAQPQNPASIITNPPYAVRLGEKGSVAALYRDMGRAFLPLSDTLAFILSASDDFESHYGARADKKRKLYNGNLKCTYYQYFRKK